MQGETRTNYLDQSMTVPYKDCSGDSTDCDPTLQTTDHPSADGSPSTNQSNNRLNSMK